MQALASRLRRGGAASPGDDDPRAPLWRGAQWFRTLSVVYAVGRQIDEADRYARIGWSWVLIGAVVLVSAIAATGYLKGFGRHLWFVIAEFAAAATLALGTVWVATGEFTAHNQALPTTLWLTNPVVSAAILSGPVGGVIGGVVIAAVNAIYRGTFPETIVRDANYPVFMAVGLGIGVAARVAITSQDRVREAERVAADARARERLAREVHDGVLRPSPSWPDGAPNSLGPARCPAARPGPSCTSWGSWRRSRSGRCGTSSPRPRTAASPRRRTRGKAPSTCGTSCGR
ncbi:DUF5931 domain-containing protein [Tsukamurella sp. PLM1]|uniref:DUF5931 domain-containing protein n=1 Tax=Tsukamurella sp. PLM1 TaxID=2929795 RepID=UPI002054BE32|nr:DUF5931 domain-containing protein [Tsukamurella sp. PLM1]BDH55310.1 hypothetical protein MTP03_02490 [Tsukamurella sp. PLM1]